MGRRFKSYRGHHHENSEIASGSCVLAARLANAFITKGFHRVSERDARLTFFKIMNKGYIILG